MTVAATLNLADVAARRLRDLRNGFRLPAGIAPANLPEGDYASPSAHARAQLDPALQWSEIDRLGGVAGLPVLVKGVLTAADARRARDAGSAGIIVSNHGGRQLDGAPPTLSVLPDVASAVSGALPVLLDGGVRRGADMLAALAGGPTRCCSAGRFCTALRPVAATG
jgi:isopentenyl diphosphate isomerase/L-lactate dehydrogenase-like FMN-dependent dehydrogenase